MAHRVEPGDGFLPDVAAFRERDRLFVAVDFLREAALDDFPSERWNACEDAEALGLRQAPLASLRGGDAAENLRLLRFVLDGTAGPLLDAVILNASAALVVAGIASDAEDGARRAGEAISSGAARRTMTRWVDRAREVRVA